MTRSSVTIIEVCKNVAEDLESLQESVETLAGYFNMSQSIFIKGDSSDRAPEILHQWVMKSAHNRTVLSAVSKKLREASNPFKGRPLPREGRIANARNLALKSMSLKTKYIIFIDMIFLQEKYGIQDIWVPFWDLICAHGINIYGAYRDIYALRLKNTTTNHHLGDLTITIYRISLMLMLPKIRRFN